jgi:hypothetical protein
VEDTSVARFLQAMFREEYQLASDSTLRPPPEIPASVDALGTGDTLYLGQRGEASNEAMTQTPASSLRRRATPRPSKAGPVIEERGDDAGGSGSARKTTPVRAPTAEGDDSGVAPRVRDTEPIQSRGKMGTQQMPAARAGSSTSQRFNRYPEPSVLVSSKVRAPDPVDEDEPSTDEPLLPRRSVVPLVVGGVVALGVLGGGLAFAVWPSPPPKEVAATAEVTKVEPAAPALHAQPSPLPAKAPAEPRAIEPPPTAVPEPEAPKEEEPQEPATRAGATKPAVDAPARPTSRMGRLVVKAVPYAVVNEGGRTLGEVLGNRVFTLRAGTYELEFIHPQRRQSQTVTVRANEDTRVEFRAAE